MSENTQPSAAPGSVKPARPPDDRPPLLSKYGIFRANFSSVKEADRFFRRQDEERERKLAEWKRSRERARESGE